ncbi:MAG: YgiT-type zinc finger protein [Negativicutes bacterium]|nr:YgiT-type zinc finger protein [Negativicutes bacterium]
MHKDNWCEHLDKVSKYTDLQYEFGQKQIVLRVQSWYCPECGVYGADTELIKSRQNENMAAG